MAQKFLRKMGAEAVKRKREFRSSLETLPRRFWSKVEKSEGCWKWTGSINSDGYGMLLFDHETGKMISAHRASWLTHHGVLPPKGSFLCHRCDNRACVNPDHLYIGTPADNSRDMVERGRSLTGMKNPAAVLTDQQIDDIKRLYALGFFQPEIARVYGVSKSQVGNIVRGESRIK